MKKALCLFLFLLTALSFAACGREQNGNETEKPELTETETEGEENMSGNSNKLLYMGHASIRITASDGTVIYVDPYAGSGYDKAADVILVTHSHFDHCDLDLVKNRNDGCRVVTWKEALEEKSFDFGAVKAEAVEAGYNRNHSSDECVGYILYLPGGVTVYVSGDTSKTEQMPSLKEKNIDYAFFCCDGIYNMDLDEAAECASLVGAKHNIPYHTAPGKLFDRSRAEKFAAENRLIIDAGEEITL